MAFLKFVWRNGLWIAVLVFVLAGAGLAVCIVGVVALQKSSEIVSLPLVETQEVEFAEAGRVVLCLEWPVLTRRDWGITFELAGANGTPVKSHTTWFPIRSSSFSRSRREMQSFDIPEPGRYVLRVEGLTGGQAAASRYRVVFTRPHLARTVGYILGIVLAGLLLVGSVVFFGLRLAFGVGKRGARGPL